MALIRTVDLCRKGLVKESYDDYNQGQCMRTCKKGKELVTRSMKWYLSSSSGGSFGTVRGSNQV